MDENGILVAEFHEKIGAPDPINIEKAVYNAATEKEINQALRDIASDLAMTKDSLTDLRRSYTEDGRILRAELIMEELSEHLEALANRDEVALADSTADIQVVAVGTNVAFDLPNASSFMAVALSNLTKHTAIGARDNVSDDRGKGESYEAPNIKQRITEWRSNDEDNSKTSD